MVRLRVKVGPKGQAVIPRTLREAYRIKENSYAVLEPREDVILIRGLEDPDLVIAWIRERRLKVKGFTGRIGELSKVDLEEEFES